MIKLAALSILVASSAWCQNFYYLPAAADGAAPTGSLRTSIFLSNQTTGTAKVAIVWTNDDGTPRTVALADLGRDSKFAITLLPGATRVLQTDGSGANLSGAAVIGSDQNIAVWGILSAFDTTGVLLGESGFAAAGISPAFRIPVDSTQDLNTGIALYNPGPGAAIVKASLLDATGAAAGSATVTLAAGARVTRFVSGDWFAGLGDFRGTLNLTSTVPLAAQVMRQSAETSVVSLLQAPPLISNRLRFYLPQLADGPATTATLRTTFLLTNLSAKPAAVKLTLTRDDGSPWSVTIPGLDPNSVFQTTIAPGASTIWQTDGAGPYTTGAASIQSTRPLGVQALVTASDADGTVISETAAVDARRQQRFALPFDSTSDPTSGAAFYNTGTKPLSLILTLRDTDGKIAASTQLAPLPAGGRAAGTIHDFFPGTPVLRGTLTANTGGPVAPFVSALAVRQNLSLPWSSTLPAGTVPLAGVPLKVTSTVDTKRAVTANIGPKGGSLSLTDAAGNKFNLTIPPNALFATEAIVMTPVTAAAGVPGTGLVAVQLAPDGLTLLAPATLVIQPVAAAPAGTTLTPVGWYGTAPGLYLSPQQPTATQTTLLLKHFSYEGTSYFKTGDLTSVLLNIVDLQAYYESELAAVLAETAAAQKAAKARGEIGPPLPDEFYDLMEAGYTEVIEPLMEIALASQDDDAIRCAMVHALGYLRQGQLLALDDSMSSAISDFIVTGMQIINDHAEKRCKDDHDFTALQDILSFQRQAQLLGVSLGGSNVADLQKDCPAQLQFDFVSQFTTHYTPGGDYRGQISSKFVLKGSFDKDVLTQVADPSKDLIASYMLSGQAPEVYDSLSFVSNICTVTASKGVAGVMNVLEQAGQNKSRVQFMFSAGYDPAPRSISGVQLCSYCPVYRKKPFKVEMVIYPGLPLELITMICPPVEGSATLTQVYWSDSWGLTHTADTDTGFSSLSNWELPSNHDPFAQTIINTKVLSTRANVTETTTVKLTRPTGAP